MEKNIINNQGLEKNFVKVKKLKIIKPTSTGDKNPLMFSNPNINNLKKTYAFANTANSNSQNSKLTFENVFNFSKKFSGPILINNNSLLNTNFNTVLTHNNINNSNSLGVGGTSNIQLPTSLSPLPNLNTPSPIVLNNLSGQPQISININNFNINNYNFNSNKLKKQMPLSVPPSHNSNNNISNNLKNVSVERVKNSTNVSDNYNTSGKKINTIKKVMSNKNLESTAEKISNSNAPGNCNNNVINQINEPSSKLKLVKSGFSNFNSNLNNNQCSNTRNKTTPKKSESSNNRNSKKKTGKIETIIDGNNDSFINELADLLNNVEKSSDGNLNNINSNVQNINEPIQVQMSNKNTINLNNDFTDIVQVQENYKEVNIGGYTNFNNHKENNNKKQEEFNEIVIEMQIYENNEV